MQHDHKLLYRYATNTWQSFVAMTSTIGLPVDHLCLQGNNVWVPARYTSPTNIATYIWSTLGAKALGLIDQQEETQRLTITLNTVYDLEEAHGFFFNW